MLVARRIGERVGPPTRRGNRPAGRALGGSGAPNDPDLSHRAEGNHDVSLVRLPPGQMRWWARSVASVSRHRPPGAEAHPAPAAGADHRERGGPGASYARCGVHSGVRMCPRSWTACPADAVASRRCVRPVLPTPAARVTRPPASGRSRPCRPCSRARAQADPDRPYLIEGLREGGRHLHVSRRRAARRSDGRRARPARRAAGRRRLVAAAELDGVRPRWPRAIDRLGAVSNPIITIYREREVGFVCRQARLARPGRSRPGARRRPPRAGARGAGGGARTRARRHRARRAGRRASARSSRSRTIPAAPLPPSPHGPHDVASIFYTSGTTADPKGVLHTPSTLGAVLHYHAQLFPPSPDDVSLLQFPLTHIGGIVMFVMLPLRSGAERRPHGGLRSGAGARPDRAPSA